MTKYFPAPLCFALLLSLGGFPASVRAAGLLATTATAHSPIKRFSQVGPRLYRGGQPDDADFMYLRDLGIRTVINLRGGDHERGLVESLGMKYVHIPVTLMPFGLGGELPRKAVERFFEVIDDPASGPIFVHCQRGADRTGAFVGLYRVLRQNWTAERAYDEARDIGMRWWYFAIKHQLEPPAMAFRVPISD